MKLNKKEKIFLELDEIQRKTYEELKNYILYKNIVIGDKKLKTLLQKYETASKKFCDFLAEKEDSHNKHPETEWGSPVGKEVW